MTIPFCERHQLDRFVGMADTKNLCAQIPTALHAQNLFKIFSNHAGYDIINMFNIGVLLRVVP